MSRASLHQYEWYIDTILELIATAGDHVGAEVWYRVVQLVTNNEDLQAYASAAVYTHLQAQQCHENMVKVGGYILGEFGHLIANEQGCSPIEQFHALHSKINICTAPTRALLLTTYLKWVNLFPEIKEHLINIFRRYTHVLDAELQQRACEYLALATRDDDDELLQAVCDEMPVFPERESALISRLHSRGDKAQDKRTWVIGHQSENKGRVAEKFKNFRKGSSAPDSPVDAAPVMPQRSAPQPQPTILEPPQRQDTAEPMMGTSGMSDDIMASLAGLDLTSTATSEGLLSGKIGNGTITGEPEVMTPTVLSPATERPDDFQHNATLGGVNPSLLAPVTVAPNIDKWLERLSYANEGVLYEDKQVQIGIKAEYHGHLGRIALFIGNKISTPFTSVSAKIENTTPDALDVKFHDLPVDRIEPLAQIQEMIQLECKSPFSGQPVLRFTYLAGSFTTLVLRLPVFLNRFIEGVNFDQAQFFERWKIIGGPPREAQQIFSIKLTDEGEVDLERNRRIMAGQRVSVLPNIDHNPNNVSNYGAATVWRLTMQLVLAGVLHMSKAGKVGILGRLEPNKDAKLCRLTVRSTNEEVSAEMLKLLGRPLNVDTASSL